MTQRNAKPLQDDAAAEWVAVADLVPWDRNPRRNDKAVPEVAASIRRFGFAAPIVARRADGMVIAGHTRLRAAVSLGLDRVPVRWMDLDVTDAQLLALADNKVGEIAEWDEDALRGILRDLDVGEATEGLGFDEEELRALLGTLDDSSVVVGAGDLGDEGAKEIGADEFSEFAHTCPRCGFEYD